MSEVNQAKTRKLKRTNSFEAELVKPPVLPELLGQARESDNQVRVRVRGVVRVWVRVRVRVGCQGERVYRRLMMPVGFCLLAGRPAKSCGRLERVCRVAGFGAPLSKGMDVKVATVSPRHAPRGMRRLGGPPGVELLMDRRPGSMDGRVRPAIRWSLVAVGLLTLLVVVACDPGSADTAPTDTSSSSSTPNPTAAPTSTTTTTFPTTTTTTVIDVTDEILAGWGAFWEAWVAVRASEDLDTGPLEEVADSDVVEDAVALFERQRESGLGAVDTDVATNAKVMGTESGVATIEDCVLLSPSFTAAAGVWYQADLRDSGSGWVVADLRVRSTKGCVPAEMATKAISGYEAYYEAQVEFWDPPDSDHPLINRVLAAPQKSFIVDLVKEHEAKGVALRGRPATHPEVIEVRSPTELVILDCFEPAHDFGLYDLDTGERIPGDVPVREGQRNLRSAVMVLDGAQWKVSDFQGQVDFVCEFAPTDRGLPSV